MKPGKKENRAKEEQRVMEVVRNLCKEVHSRHAMCEEITLDSTFEKDLGLDSLSRVELISRVEATFKLSLSEHTFAQAQTPRDLLRAIQTTHYDTIEISASREPVQETQVTSDLPNKVETLVELLEWHVKQHPKRPHIQFYQDDGKGEIITYEELQTEAQKVALSLQEYGLKKGDRVAMMLPTGREYFFCYFGILIAGGIAVPIYPPARLSQLEEHIIRHSKILQNSLAQILITVPEAVSLAQLLKSQVPTLKEIVSASKLFESLGKAVRPVLHASDIAFIQYTSGSTGDPKGVTLSHANLLANIRAMGEAVDANSKDVFVSWLPLYHDMGLIGAWLGSLYFGALYVVMSPLSFLAKPQRWLWAIHRYHGTLSASPNFGYEYCLHRAKESDFEGLDLSSWRGAFNGAEAVSAQTLKHFTDYFASFGFSKKAMMPVYGLAESSVGLAFTPLGRGALVDDIQRETFMKSAKALPAQADEAHALHFVSSGVPLREHQIRIVDKMSHELPERQEGELQFRGPSSTSGYFRNAQKTKELFDGEWLRSGDLAYIAEGELYITGRIKDVIIRAGRNIYPDELERAIGDISGIRKGCVAIFGSVDPKTSTERLIVLAETHTQDPALKNKLRLAINSLATDLIGTPPDEVVLGAPGSVLKTSSGKIRRSASREMYKKGEIGEKSKAVVWQIVRLALSGILPQFWRFYTYIKSLLFAFYGWSVFLLILPIAWLGAVFLPTHNLRCKVVGFFARVLIKATGTPLKVIGLQNIPDTSQSYIMVLNHASYIDSIVVSAALRGPFHFVAKAELSEGILTRLPLERLQTEFVERFDTGKSVDDAQRLVNALKNTKQLLFFAEGTFSRIPGLQPFHLGAFKAAVDAGVPIIPIAIRGTRSILRAGSWFVYHGSITVTVGEAIDPAKIAKEAQSQMSWKLAIALRDSAREFILRHCGEPDLAP